MNTNIKWLFLLAFITVSMSGCYFNDDDNDFARCIEGEGETVTQQLNGSQEPEATITLAGHLQKPARTDSQTTPTVGTSLRRSTLCSIQRDYSSNIATPV